MSSGIKLSRFPWPGRLAAGVIALVSLLSLLAFTAPASQAIILKPVTADAVLLEAEEAPWNDEFNPEAMKAVFGANWERQEFETVVDEGPGGLFAPHVQFIWIEGGDETTAEARHFIESHAVQLMAFVARGGKLFINSATNQEITISYDGRTIGKVDSEDFTPAAVAVDPANPIFNGPASPNATSFTGDSFAHGRVLGPGLTPLIRGTLNDDETGVATPDAVVLAEYSSGSGRVFLGSMTVVRFHEPEAAAKSLLINILSNLAFPPPPPVTPIAAPAPEAHCVVPKLKGKKLKAAKKRLRRADCKIGHVGKRKGVSAKTGKVVKQKPKPGKVLPAGSTVKVTLGGRSAN